MIKIDNLPEIFTKAMPVLQILENAGFEAYFVGGSVRDVLLHRHVHDVDITTSAYPEEVKELFDKSIDTGIKHGTVTVLYGGESYEITTFRTESGYQDFRRPDHVTFVQNLDEDLIKNMFKEEYYNINLIGSLKTKRKVFLGENFTLCLDKNIFLKSVDYEIEIEIENDMNNELHNLIKPLLQNMFKRNTVGKFSRFYNRYMEIKNGCPQRD